MHAATLNANILPRRPRMMQPARLVSPCTRAPTPRAREMLVASLSALVCGRSCRARCRVASHTARSQRRARVSTCPSDDGPSTDWIGRAAGMARRPAGGRRSSARDRPKSGRVPNSRGSQMHTRDVLRGAGMGRRPDAIGGVKPFVCTWEGPEPTPPSRNGRVTADFQRSIHLLGFRVLRA